ncbi:MAG: ATP--guanido phosphotransferase, partial [Clostridia bacterium]
MESEKDIVYSTRVRLARNITALPFPNKLNGEEEIYSVLMKNVDEACNKFCKTTVYKMSELSAIDGRALVERHLASPDLIANCPYGALILNKNEDISIMLNEEDHIRAQCIMSGWQLESAYNRIAKIDEEIAKRVDYAFDKNFGYLTACPTNLGAGMRASAMLFLPALSMSGSINSILNEYRANGITVRGVYGEGSKVEGYLYQFSNQASISLSEKEIINTMNMVIRKLVDAEKIARKNLSNSRVVELKNEIMRAYGILQ